MLHSLPTETWSLCILQLFRDVSAPSSAPSSCLVYTEKLTKTVIPGWLPVWTLCSGIKYGVFNPRILTWLWKYTNYSGLQMIFVPE